MSALNALDELLPGPEQQGAQAPPPPPVGGRARGSRRSGAFNMLDELLPGPDRNPTGHSGAGGAGGPEQARPEPPPIPLRLTPQEGTTARVVPLRSTGAGGALDAFLAGAPAPKPRRAPRTGPPDRVRTTFKVSTDVLRAVRDAIGRMAAEPGNRMTMDELTERALQAELKRIARRRRDQARRAAERAERG